MSDPAQKRQLYESDASTFLSSFPSPAPKPPLTFDLSIVALAQLSKPLSEKEHDRILITADTTIFHWDLRNLACAVTFALYQVHLYVFVSLNPRMKPDAETGGDGQHIASGPVTASQADTSGPQGNDNDHPSG
jgi:hypothetical protein